MFADPPIATSIAVAFSNAERDATARERNLQLVVYTPALGSRHASHSD